MAPHKSRVSVLAGEVRIQRALLQQQQDLRVRVPAVREQDGFAFHASGRMDRSAPSWIIRRAKVNCLFYVPINKVVRRR
ncbi:hypothetical protein EON64_07405 [archaeon]|nr:MAG: hypothetical protein EON64_07405 [archaeon]